MAAPTTAYVSSLRIMASLCPGGTLTDGLQRLKVLFEPLMPVLYERQMTEKLLHGDETRWEVCEEVEGKRVIAGIYG